MTPPNSDVDRLFDNFLRETGPEVPQPELDEESRARLMALIGNTPARSGFETVGRSRGRVRRAALAGAVLAVALVPACILLWVKLGHVKEHLSMSRWETQEVFQLLAKARDTQPSIPVPERLEGLSSSDLLLITFHHNLCPLARVCTPEFAEMAKRHDGESVRFLTFDVTGSKRDAVGKEIDALGIGFAMFGPPGAETGVVKVVDATHQRLLCSAPGRQGLEQAELLLARVRNAERRP